MRMLLSFVFSVMLSANTLFAQYEQYGLSQNDGLCSSTILLYSNKTFLSEYGCEASSHVCFGEWKQVKDTLLFQPVNPRKFNLIKKVDSFKT